MDDGGKLDGLIEMVSGLPAMKGSMDGIVNNLTGLANVVQAMEKSVAGIEALQAQVAAHGKVIEEMQKKPNIVNDGEGPGVCFTTPNKRRRLAAGSGAGSSVSTANSIENVNEKLVKLLGHGGQPGPRREAAGVHEGAGGDGREHDRPRLQDLRQVWQGDRDQVLHC